MRVVRLIATLKNVVLGQGHHSPKLFQSPISRRLEGALSVRAKLEWLQECNGQFVDLPIEQYLDANRQAIAAGIVIGYRQCFNSGSRGYRLSDEKIKRPLPAFLPIHNRILEVADKAVAHHETWLDQVVVGGIVNSRGGFCGIGINHLQAALLRTTEHAALQSALPQLISIVDKDVERLEHQYAQFVGALSLDERLSASDAFAKMRLKQDGSEQDSVAV